MSAFSFVTITPLLPVSRRKVEEEKAKLATEPEVIERERLREETRRAEIDLIQEIQLWAPFLIAAGFFWLARNKPEVLKVALKEGARAFGNIMSSLLQAGSSNRIRSWAAPSLLALMLDQLGLIPKGAAQAFAVGLAILTGAEVAAEYAETITGIFPFSRPPDTDFPTTVQFDVQDVSEAR